MGAHANYYWIIHYLVLMKKEFHRIKAVKFQSLITELERYTVEDHSDNDHLPSHKELAKTFGFNQTKMNKLIKDLYHQLTGDFHRSPLTIKECIHAGRALRNVEVEGSLAELLGKNEVGQLRFLFRILELAMQINKKQGRRRKALLTVDNEFLTILVADNNRTQKIVAIVFHRATLIARLVALQKFL